MFNITRVDAALIPVKTGIQPFFEFCTPASAEVTNFIFVPNDKISA